ncbi:MAG: RlmE family RNA methyltransferase [Spirochaetota bacterium]
MARRSRRDRPDHYSNQARREGYQARSVYKLEELDKRFGLLRPGMHVLDVGAAPGSWTQYARKIVGGSGLVVAVDLSELPALDGLSNVEAVVGDIYETEVVARLAASGPFGAIISDAAPKTTGNRTVDTARSAALVEQVLALCERLLVSDGNVVAKVFQGGEEQALLAEVRRLFRTGRLIKPRASRDESFETFLVGQGYRGSAPGQ